MVHLLELRKVVKTLETSGDTGPTTQRHILEDLHLYKHCCENLKSRTSSPTNHKIFL
jgi:hypothetical protein